MVNREPTKKGLTKKYHVIMLTEIQSTFLKEFTIDANIPRINN